MNLSNWKIRSKLALLVGVMAIIIAGVAAVGVVYLRNASYSLGEVTTSGAEALTTALMTQNFIALNRAEYNIASNPTSENLKGRLKLLEAQRKMLEERLTTLRTTASAEEMPMLDQVQQDYQGYLKTLQHTFDVAPQVVDKVQLTPEQKSLVESVAQSRPLVDALQKTINAYADYTKDKGNKLSDSAKADAGFAETLMIVVTLAGVLGGAAFGYLLGTFGIAKPLAQSIGNLNRLSQGDLKIEITGGARRDEMGDIAQAMQVFKDNMSETERLRAAQEAAKKQAETDRRKLMLDLADRFEANVGGVVGAVTTAAGELQVTAQSLSATAEETSRQSNAVAAASEQMTQNVQTVASATEELSASIHEIANQVTESSRIVGSAVTQAEETNAKVRQLSEAAKRIGDVVTLINQIASQTNLLALNATIEAARAGEAGKGFAVVASEVKNLATQTASATDEIAGQVRAIQESTESSASSIETISRTIDRVNEISTAIASAVEEQGAATQEISRNVQQAASGTNEVSTNIGGVTEASQQTNAGSTQVLAAASALAKNGMVLQQQVSEFLREIRAG